MITLNGVKFALNDKEFTDSLFEKDGTCAGYYRPYKRQIILMDMQKNRIGVICNRVVGKADKMENGKYWYSYMRPTILGDWDTYPSNIMEKDLDRIYKQYPMPVKY
jgi:hypothetical protein